MAVTLTQIRAFLAVRSTGSVHAAAGQLLVSQPSVSAAVASLARELGTVLFERHGRGVRLTESGEAFAPYAAEVLGLLEQGRNAAQEAANPENSKVRLVAVNTAGEYLAPPLIQAYRRPATRDATWPPKDRTSSSKPPGSLVSWPPRWKPGRRSGLSSRPLTSRM